MNIYLNMLEIKMKNIFEFCGILQTQYPFICKAGVCRTPVLVSRPLVKTTRCNYQKLSLSFIQTQKSSQGAKASKKCGMGPCLTASWQVTWLHTMEQPLFQIAIHWYSFWNWSFFFYNQHKLFEITIHIQHILPKNISWLNN